MSEYQRSLSFSEHRGNPIFNEALFNSHAHAQPLPPGHLAKRPQPHPRGPPTPSMSTPAADFEQQLMGSPPPPPTPAASPRPVTSVVLQANWDTDAVDEKYYLANLRKHFADCTSPQRTRLLAGLLSLCTSQQLSFVHQFVSPLLKKDPFTSMPDELCLRHATVLESDRNLPHCRKLSVRTLTLGLQILTFIDDPKVLARASQVSRRWRDLLSDDMTWKNLCVKHDYQRRLSEVQSSIQAPQGLAGHIIQTNGHRPSEAYPAVGAEGSRDSTSGSLPRFRSYKSHFKQRYLVDAAWRTGGRNITKSITQDGGVVTSLHLTSKYIIVGLDNAKIHVFNIEGNAQRTLTGHVMGVWAMVPWEDILVSGGCDRDVRVWNLATGECLHTLRGHTSTVRCLKMSDSSTAISGSRDTTLRVWDIRNGTCTKVLMGHQASVRCLEIKGDLVVSGSYDTMAKIWSISEGRCLHTLQGHYSQIYAIAFDGFRVATGSLDTSVRIWNARTGECQAVLQGHTSLVGQLQMRGGTLVTGGSDGSVRVWSLEKFCPIHRLAAHDNSVTSLQFDDTRVVSGGSDGRVKVWDLRTGHLVRELISQGEAVWRVAFVDEKCVVMALRNGRTVMEVWNFTPPEENHERLASVPQIEAPVPARPMSSISLGYPSSAPMYTDDVDVTMTDSTPSAIFVHPPVTHLQQNTPAFHDDVAFFHDD